MSLWFLQHFNKPLLWRVTQVLSQSAQQQRHFKNRKKTGPVKDANWEERLSDVATPLWRKEYKEQLECKLQAMKVILRNLTVLVRERGGDVLDFDGLICPLREILPSPVINEYRNKSSFSVNFGPDGDQKTVGNFVGKCREGNLVCVRTNHLLNIPEKHKLVAKYYEEFLHQSLLPPCLLFHKGGHWRDLVVRTNREGETMAIVTFHPQNLSKDEVQLHILSLQHYFTQGPGSDCNLSSLYYQENDPVTHQPSPPRLLFGSPYLTEQVLDLRIWVSPLSFLQVNTSAAEILYTAMGHMIPSSANGTLLDVCCGTGAIGLSMAGRFENVIGVELVEDAVSDACRNASFNGIKNCCFVPGRAEKILPKLLTNSQEEGTVVAVVNPPRGGLHHHVIRALRCCENIKMLLFVTCKPEGEATRNLTELCCPPSPEQKILGEAFVAQEALAVDMFPHTLHCELAILLTR